MNVTHTSMLSTVVPGVMSMSNRPKNCQFSFRSILRLKINFWDDSKIDNNLLMIDDFVQIDESLPPCTRFQEFIHSQCIMKLMHCTVCCVSCLLSCDLEFVKSVLLPSIKELVANPNDAVSESMLLNIPDFCEQLEKSFPDEFDEILLSDILPSIYDIINTYADYVGDGSFAKLIKTSSNDVAAVIESAKSELKDLTTGTPLPNAPSPTAPTPDTPENDAEYEVIRNEALENRSVESVMELYRSFNSTFAGSSWIGEMTNLNNCVLGESNTDDRK